ncbi:molybdate ABC transporter substrate-binding protein [Blastococcus sp. LR1]|uniref:molybdate ABC transporter substrate-binding protein n=1 Tax=Blastococcus sp. LR1 TaxID=2877000 RepID=UPI001CCC3E57|nr:molybdate ABC transporter substrate-binding protein [Blastococcus sp. LR1]MCA0145676.1 molybdate ABC transporter substrate-binding protein [Blastococcus sp. LR1]
MRVPVLLLPLLLALSACTAQDADAPPEEAAAGSAAPAADELSGTLTVFAAASLTDVFTALGEELEAQHPRLEVEFNFAGSSALAGQIAQGAPADVFASADEVQMDRLTGEALVESTDVFAQNAMMLAVPVENPAGIALPGGGGVPTLATLLPDDVTMAVCAPEVPCGALSAQLLEAAGLADVPDTYEEDVRAVLTKVQLGEVDAGLVYVTDVRASGGSVLAFGFREGIAPRNAYPVGVLEDAPNPAAARAFTDLLLSEEGQRVLTDAGFFEP